MTKLRLPAPVLLAMAICLALAAPASGEEEELVPPENSAVAQYTEPFPTAGGETDAHGQKPSKASPNKTLGAGNAARLAKQGPEGRAVAELAAETAPSAAAEQGSDGDRRDDREAAGAGRRGGAPPADRGGGSGVALDAPDAGGSSGIATVLSEALGSSSGGIGLLLPFLLLGTAAWALVYALRQRRAASRP